MAWISALVAWPSLIQLNVAAPGPMPEVWCHLPTYNVPAERSALRSAMNMKKSAIGGVVAHQHGALVGHHLHQFVRDAAQAIVLAHAAGAVRVHGDFRQMPVVVGVGFFSGSPYKCVL